MITIDVKMPVIKDGDTIRYEGRDGRTYHGKVTSWHHDQDSTVILFTVQGLHSGSKIVPSYNVREIVLKP